MSLRVSFSSTPFPLAPLHPRCLHRCWSPHRGRWSPGPGSCEAALLLPGTDNRSISFWASTAFKQKTDERINTRFMIKTTNIHVVSLIKVYLLHWMDELRNFGILRIRKAPGYRVSLKIKTISLDFYFFKKDFIY